MACNKAAHQAQLSVLASFFERLPQLTHRGQALPFHPRQTTGRKYRIHKSDMVYADPPPFLEALDLDLILNKAEKLLEIAGSNTELECMVPPLQAGLGLETVSDVKHATHLYLTFAVNQALDYYNSLKGYVSYSQADKIPSGSHRGNISWTVTKDGKERTFAVMEFRNTCEINELDFSKAWVEGRNKQDMLHEMYGRGIKTALEFNASKIGQHAAHYAYDQKIKYVCFFDWHSLAMFEFPDVRGGGSLESIPRGHIFTEEGKENAKTVTIRKLLLGFLCLAYDAALKDPSFWREAGLSSFPTKIAV